MDEAHVWNECTKANGAEVLIFPDAAAFFLQDDDTRLRPSSAPFKTHRSQCQHYFARQERGIGAAGLEMFRTQTCLWFRVHSNVNFRLRIWQAVSLKNAVSFSCTATTRLCNKAVTPSSRAKCMNFTGLCQRRTIFLSCDRIPLRPWRVLPSGPFLPLLDASARSSS